MQDYLRDQSQAQTETYILTDTIISLEDLKKEKKNIPYWSALM